MLFVAFFGLRIVFQDALMKWYESGSWFCGVSNMIGHGFQWWRGFSV